MDVSFTLKNIVFFFNALKEQVRAEMLKDKMSKIQIKCNCQAIVFFFEGH